MSLGIDTCSQGISLSGGQKQRINICRAIYVGADIQIFDDPISALDAHVGKHVFQHVFLGAAQDKTRILVTHALHFLPQVDYIYTMVDGRVGEHGTYADLMAANGDFARFVNEFGSKESELEKEEEATAEGGDAEDEKDDKAVEKLKKRQQGATMMQQEERNTGAVSNQVYMEYIRAGKGYIIIPLLVLSVALLQGAQVMSSYWLVYWQEMYVLSLRSFMIPMTDVSLQEMAVWSWILHGHLRRPRCLSSHHILHGRLRIRRADILRVPSAAQSCHPAGHVRPNVVL